MALAVAAVLESQPLLAYLGLAVLGAIVGLVVGFGIAEVVVLVAHGFGDEEQSSRFGRFVQCLDQLIDRASP